MGCEMGELSVKVSKKHIPAFVEVFNAVMKKKEPWFKEEHAIAVEDFEDESWSDDIHSRFEDPNSPHLLDVAKLFLKDNLDAKLTINYGLQWDNCGEDHYENYYYENNELKCEYRDLMQKDEFDDWDDEGEFDEDAFDEDEFYDDEEFYFECEEKIMSLIDGKWKIIKKNKYKDAY